MDARTFDRLIADAAQPSRRRALRFLAAGLLGGLLASRWAAPAVAQTYGDGDSDDLLDADETAIYGTNPNAYDTDGDGLSDGEEVIYYGTNPLVADANTIQVDNDGDGLQDADERNIYGTQPLNYDTDGDGVGDGQEVSNGTDPNSGVVVYQDPPPPTSVDGGNANGTGCYATDAAGNCICFAVDSNGNCLIGVADTQDVTCRGVGSTCNNDAECCGPSVLCCFDGTYLSTRCTDVTAYGGVCL
jgi:hypothetical protein